MHTVTVKHFVKDWDMRRIVDLRWDDRISKLNDNEVLLALNVRCSIARFIDQHRTGAKGRRLLNKLMTVEVFAAQRDKETSGR